MSITIPQWIQALMLGLIQGITEFLPVSSSGHLTIAPYLLQLEPPQLVFNVLLHVATLLAVLLYFRGDLWFLLQGTLGMAALTEADHKRARLTVLLLGIGSVPAAFAGLFLKDLVGGTFQDPRIAAGFLFVTAGLLVFAERLRTQRTAAVHGDEAAEDPTLDVGRDERTITVKDAVIIGVAQAFAIIPGISRAGSTMAMGMVRGLTRTAAARYSFLLSIPIIAGAGVAELLAYESGGFGTYSTGSVVIAVVAAAASGYWAIRFLLRLVSNDRLTGFALYLVALGVFVLVGQLWLGPPDTLGI